MDTAVLLLSELMANATRHARVPPGREVWMRAAWADDRLRVEVLDANRALPVVRAARAADEGGRGLAIVAALAGEWGRTRGRAGSGRWCGSSWRRRAGSCSDRVVSACWAGMSTGTLAIMIGVSARSGHP
ncbi:ATP-binding protein [Streptomyces sp. NPDC090022]|uniref:ATP-binding protein n=1 Tax=Streptomyces sp. NPDC090022 TaxID=3365920 RepID=UPI0037F93B90